jgi:hypothetical protein
MDLRSQVSGFQIDDYSISDFCHQVEGLRPNGHEPEMLYNCSVSLRLAGME